MQHSSEIIISDTSCLILLGKIDEIDVLHRLCDKGRKVAERLHLRYSGTLGLLLQAKRAGILPALRPVVVKIRDTNFRFSKPLLDYILEQAGE